ncbi:hypothetical protein M413DRAFT_243385 [Hebeloma cylindrosporum]|uniref:Uncharacterized protein n=1 Tax=Hebeloma cylindrosporum TaxID=76867 RepID=A0A0C2YC28_HEBCY|nr:hypothetical protein M413DRAFT_243385 [Hebeloma cylindrosporum h7]
MVQSTLLFWVLATFLGSDLLAGLGALASLYPTKPVASTIYIAGQAAEVSWMDDGKVPLLNATAGIRIDLYAGNNTFLATCAKDVNAMDLSRTIFIPSFIPANFHVYTLRFIATYPPQIIYTADFTIIPSPLAPESSPKRRPSASSSSVPATVTKTILSRIAGTFSFPSPTAPATQQHGSAGLGKTGALRGKGPSAGWDIERIKFRIVFIVWPALVGLSMAL